MFNYGPRNCKDYKKARIKKLDVDTANQDSF